MNLKSNKKSKFWCIPYVMLTLLAFFLGSCDDGKEVSPITGSGGTPFNPAFLFVLIVFTLKQALQGKEYLFMERILEIILPNWKFILVVRKARL